MSIWTFAAFASAQLNYNNPIYIPEYIQTQSSVVAAVQEPPTVNDQASATANINFQQLPNPELSQPFYTPEPQPSTYLKAPTEDAGVTNFNPHLYPNLPAQDLQVPSLIKWNPNNDPNLYYPVVVEKIVPLNIPTSQYPKKYNKNLQKIKPSGFKPKDVVLIDDIAGSQKDIDKAIFSLAKQENKKLLELEKFSINDNSQAQVTKVKDTVPAESVFGGLSSSNSFATHGDFGSSSSGFSEALTGGHGGDRMQFHIEGHSGPKSYKWGYDTGKG